jgi:hypothetical protein
MNWIIKPGVYADGHEGFAIGDKVLDLNGRPAVVTTAEAHAHICSIYRNSRVFYIPIRYDDGHVTGWETKTVTLVKRGQNMILRGNELILEES